MRVKGLERRRIIQNEDVQAMHSPKHQGFPLLAFGLLLLCAYVAKQTRENLARTPQASHSWPLAIHGMPAPGSICSPQYVRATQSALPARPVAQNVGLLRPGVVAYNFGLLGFHVQPSWSPGADRI